MVNRVNESIMDAVRDVMGFVRYIVNNPNDVEIHIKPGPYRITAELYTNPSDVGQVIGRNGHVVASLRSLLSAIAGKNKIRINFDYVTEEDNFRKSARFVDDGSVDMM